MRLLTEEFIQEYNDYIDQVYDQYESEENARSLKEAYESFTSTINLLENYFSLNEKLDNNKNIVFEQEGSAKEMTDGVLDLVKQVTDIFKDTKEDIGFNIDFKPQTNIKDVIKLKFPHNIIYVVQTIIKWLGNLVKGFISGTTNTLRRVAGLKPAEEFKFEKLDLEKTKNMDVQAVPANLATLGKISIYRRKEDGDIKTEAAEPDKRKENFSDRHKEAIVIDISKELAELRQLVGHFINLFESSFGSNNERLFATEDLELVLKLLRDNIKSLEKGTTVTYAVGGGTVDSTVDLGGIKSSLILTNNNVNSLKQAYLNTQNKIKDIVAIITQRQLYASAKLGGLMKFYNDSTYKEFQEMIKFIKPYGSKMAKLEKQMAKMGNQYTKLIAEVGRLRAPIMGLGTTSYQTAYSKRINQIFEAAKYMSQVVTLRLSALTMYINSLREVYYVLDQANKINNPKANRESLFSKRLGSIY